MMAFLINAIGYVRLNVRDLKAAKSDATDVLGLHETGDAAGMVMMSSNGRRAELILQQSSENSCRCIGLEAVSADAVGEIAARIEKLMAGASSVGRRVCLSSRPPLLLRRPRGTSSRLIRRSQTTFISGAGPSPGWVRAGSTI